MTQTTGKFRCSCVAGLLLLTACTGFEVATCIVIGLYGLLVLSLSCCDKDVGSTAPACICMAKLTWSTGRLLQCLNACCDVTVQEPCLQAQMSEDNAEQGFFLSALHAFVTRTCYANAGGEQYMLSADSMLACFLCII